MEKKVFVYGLCDVFYDSYYIQGLKETFGKIEFDTAEFPTFRQGTFAFKVCNFQEEKRFIIDSRDSGEIDVDALNWCTSYGKVNFNSQNLQVKTCRKIIAIGPSFGIKIWGLLQTFYFLTIHYFKFRGTISNKREFVANYWRQYRRLPLKSYSSEESSNNKVFFISSIWKQESLTNDYRATFIKKCKTNKKISFEGGFAARTDGNNFGFDRFVYSKRISLAKYLKNIKRSALVFNTPAVLSCHGWKLAEFLALGKAIISTPHINILPQELVEGTNILYAANKDEIADRIELLIANVNLKRNLETNSRLYFDEYLSPKRVINRLVEFENFEDV
jgi:hypothetical protein